MALPKFYFAARVPAQWVGRKMSEQ